MPFDIAIVGAGSAGCVLAARLTEDPDRSVVLLEAGPDYPAVADMPSEIRSGLRPVFTHDWGYRAETALDGRVVDANRARIVGGCSATNAAFALRGRPEDYNAWDAMGCTGWSFAEVLSFFEKSYYARLPFGSARRRIDAFRSLVSGLRSDFLVRVRLLVRHGRLWRRGENRRSQQ